MIMGSHKKETSLKFVYRNFLCVYAHICGIYDTERIYALGYKDISILETGCDRRKAYVRPHKAPKHWK